MLGVIIGDVAGSFREFSKDKFIELPLIPDVDFVPLAQRSRYGFTDDSLMTLATWIALQNTNVSEEHFRYAYYNFGKKFQYRGYGKMFSQWLSENYSDALPYNSCGNGSAMRVSPVGWVAKTPEECRDLAVKSASVTHNHPEGIKGAVFTALMIYYYRNVIKNPEEKIKKEYGISYGRCSGYDHFDKTCQETLPLALHVLDATENFQDAVKMAVTIPNADSDTLGAIVGSIAEAKYGLPVDLSLKAIKFVPSDASGVLQSLLWNHYKKPLTFISAINL